MGLPGFSGFAAEMQVLVGAWQTFPVFAILAGVGILLGIAYTLRVLIKAFYSETSTPTAGAAHCEPISIPEKIGDFPTLGSTLVFETSVDDYAEVWVDGEQWATICAIGAGGPVGQVADRLGLREFAACRAVKAVVDAGLAAVAPASADTRHLTAVGAA